MKPGTVLPSCFLEKMDAKDRPAGRAGMTTAEGQASYAAGQEKALQRDVANLLRQRNIWFRQMPFGKKTPWPGWSDFFCVLPDGSPLFLEMKSGYEQQTPEQVEFEASLPRTCYFVIRNLTQLQALLPK